AGKEMLLQHLASNNFTIGGQKCRDALGWSAGEVNMGPKDILEGHRLFVQSTSANRVIQPGTHVLFEVDDAIYAKHQKTSEIAEDEHKKTGADQHAFLDLAKDYNWDAVKRMVNEKPLIVSAHPAQRWSALHQAAASGDEGVVRFLLDKGASVDVTNKEGQTPADVAANAKIKQNYAASADAF
ncbi:unnamed protein product, partial [Prorocentrum cordatum]